MALQDVVTREYTINLHKRVCLTDFFYASMSLVKTGLRIQDIGLNLSLRLKLLWCWAKLKNITT